MDLSVSAKALSGSITPPPFKSEVIRALILYALCGVRPGSVLLPDYRLGGDINAAINAIDRAFFSENKSEAIPVYESASLLRMLAPIMLAKRGGAEFIVSPSLFRRDIESFVRKIEGSFEKTGGSIIRISGKIEPKLYEIDASRSSQFASGMLLCCALIPGLRLRICDPVSVPYIELTLQQMRRFSVDIRQDSDGVYSIADEEMRLPRPPAEMRFCADGSYAANFIAANCIMTGRCDGPVTVNGEETTIRQPDHAIYMLAGLDDISVRDCPDLFPILAVCALARDSKTVIRDTARLRDKESDRVEAVRCMIASLGGSMDVFPDHAVINGCGGKLCGGEVDSFGDHRIVMAAAIASLMCRQPVLIRGAEAVNKSAVGFFNDFCSLGGTVNELIR